MANKGMNAVKRLAISPRIVQQVNNTANNSVFKEPTLFQRVLNQTIREREGAGGGIAEGNAMNYFSCRVFGNYEVMPWKNGLGVSSEVTVVPPNINFRLEPFTFRVSISTISSPCSFSLFHGYDRISMRLEGEPMKLKHNHSAASVITPLRVPYAFKGEWQTDCHLGEDTKAKDVHLIYSRDRAQADVKTLTVEPQTEGVSIEQEKKGTTLIYCIEGETDIFLFTKSDGDQKKEKPDFTLKVGETFEANLIIDSNLGLKFVNASAAPCLLFVMQMTVKEKLPTVAAPASDMAKALLVEGEDNSFTYDSNATWKIWTSEAEERKAKGKEKYPHLSRMRSETLLFERCAPAEIYKPPPLRSRYRNESEVPPAIIKDALDINEFPKGEIRTAWINMVRNGLGEWIRVPVVVARGVENGPVLGVTAAVHGNELNGLPCIHRVISALDISKLKGTVVGVPCVNITGYLQCKREYSDGVDLNRCFPGKKEGTSSQTFCYAFMERVVKPNFTYLIDLHTASFGRINSYYVRADLNDPVAKTLATLQQPQIILHDGGQDGTLRGAATKAGIKAITVEIGNPQLLQTQFVQWTTNGIMNVLKHFQMFDSSEAIPTGCTPMICNKGYWTYTDSGGLLEVYPPVNSLVKKGDLVARIKNIFGNYVEEYFADNDCVVIGRSSNPVATQGARIMHVGLVHNGGELPKAVHENY